MLPRPVRPVLLAIACATLVGCAAQPRQIKTSAFEYLYPTGSPTQPSTDVTLRLPVRVGIAFAPAKPQSGDTFTEEQKRQLLERVAASFRGRDGIAGVDVLPSSLLKPGGGFDEIDRIRRAYGIDLVALVSYDQFQFSETTRASWTYWTLVGAYLVKGEKNETRTVIDAVVYDVISRALLFTAAGTSSVGGKSTPVDVSKQLRSASDLGFSQAVDSLIPQLDAALAAFQQQAATGTVRGPGTPAIAMIDARGEPIVSGGGGGGGALGALELLAAALLAAGATASRPRA